MLSNQKLGILILIFFVTVTVMFTQLTRVVEMDISHTEPASQCHVTSGSEPSQRKFPKILHRVFGFWDSTIPDPWKKNLASCNEKLNGFTLMMWNKSSSVEFLTSHYPWFLEVFHSYRYEVQRADAIRYFILFHYGGLYIDMDLGCPNNKSLTKLYQTLSPNENQTDTVTLEAKPMGITNFFIVSKQCSKFMKHVMLRLRNSNYWYVSPYLTVMLTTGPVFLTKRAYEFNNTSPMDTIMLLRNNQFWQHHFTGGGKHGTWHGWDSAVATVFHDGIEFKKLNIAIIVLLSLIVVVVLYYLRRVVKNKRHTVRSM